MQIHEITQSKLDEGLASIAKKAGQAVSRSPIGTVGRDIAGAIKTPFRKIAAVVGTPGAMTNPALAAAALDQLERTKIAKSNSQAMSLLGNTPPSGQRYVISLQTQGQTLPTIYYKTGNTWTNELGQKITSPDSIKDLDSKILTHGQVQRIPAAPDANTPVRRTVSRRRVVK